jgi:membrane-bound metal-dependent hydrolase YbcI (DUF457 family)
MPLTPLHFGINGYIASISQKKLDIASMIFANIVLDIQPFLALIVGIPISIHGFSHSLIGAILICFLAALIYGYSFKLVFLHSRSILFFCNSWILGGIFHVILDALFHPDVQLFYPISKFYFSNPLTTVLSLLICILGYLLWILVLDF